MIDTALTFLTNRLDEYIVQKTGETDKISMTKIVNDSGECLIPPDTIGCVLVNVEEERVMKSQSPYGDAINGVIGKRNPEIKVNLYVLFAVNPTVDAGSSTNNYDQGLRLLSLVISYFQSRNDFNTQNSPELDASIEKLKLDLYTLPIEQQNYLWGALGAKYMPSVIYRVRLLVFQEDALLVSGPEVQNVTVNTSGE